MKKFWLHILKIIVPIFIFFLVLEIAIRKIPNDYQLKKSYLDKNASKINDIRFRFMIRSQASSFGAFSYVDSTLKRFFEVEKEQITIKSNKTKTK
jgi:hypothetical protein